MAKLIINDHEYTLTDTDLNALLHVFWSDVLKMYNEKVNPEIQFGLQLFARNKLFDYERNAIDMGRDDLAPQFRPPMGADPVIHLGAVYMQVFEEALRNANLTARTNSTNQVTALSFTAENPNESGRQLAFGWTQG